MNHGLLLLPLPPGEDGGEGRGVHRSAVPVRRSETLTPTLSPRGEGVMNAAELLLLPLPPGEGGGEGRGGHRGAVPARRSEALTPTLSPRGEGVMNPTELLSPRERES